MIDKDELQAAQLNDIAVTQRLFAHFTSIDRGAVGAVQIPDTPGPAFFFDPPLFAELLSVAFAEDSALDFSDFEEELSDELLAVFESSLARF